MNVYKFGGSILRDAQDFEALARVVSEAGHKPLLVIVSALGTTTRQLDAACQAALHDTELSQTALHRIIEESVHLGTQLLRGAEHRQSFEQSMSEVQQQVQQFLRGVSITQQLTARVRDKVLSYGEFIALRLVSAFLLDRGLDTSSIDAQDIIVTDETFGAAQPLRRETLHQVARRLLPLFERHPIVVMQGFVARSAGGQTTTMGRESSNLSAALMAQLLQADELRVFTNVDGIRSADPGLVAQTKLIARLSYAQAYTLASGGVKLLYPTMIEPLRAAQVPLSIQHLNNSHSEETRVSANGTAEDLRCALLLPSMSYGELRAGSQKSAEHLFKEFLPRLLQRASLPFLSLRASQLSFVAEAEHLNQLLAGAPEDCQPYRHDGVDLIRLIHPPQCRTEALLDVCKNFDDASAILQADFCDTLSTSHVICRSEHSQALYTALHDALVQL